MRKFCTTLLLAIVMQNLVAQQATLLFFGDIMGHSGQINSAQQADGSYDYEPTLTYIERFIQKKIKDSLLITLIMCILEVLK
ncbi:hypothetical protein [Xiashengella succiniciproducens]|uniref:Alkaline phosphatase n=1 Tax=Xiashengella succiniciproducens TaxID=2949635 RepID=A0A9J6ZP34_9BACT|nr:hypothetical protein [Alkaliflexus sp. Ai-910]URW79461.1 hypothetical protein M9189_11425 [Alkaliflexus sp. Ai-910]